MQLTTPPEMTTAVTDFLLGCLALFFLFRVRAMKDKEPVKTGIWSWVYGLLALASFYGTVAHAVVMTREALDIFWMPLFFVLGMMVSVFVIAVIYEWKGTRALKKAISIMLATGILFFVVMLVLSNFMAGYFIVFIGYSGLAMVFSLVLYLYLAAHRKDGSLVFMAAGIAAIIVASALQAMRSIYFTLIWQFDYNSVYHFILMGATLFIYLGIRKCSDT